MPDVEISEFYPSRPLTETDLTWIIMRILVEKQKAALDMLIAEKQGQPAFFKFNCDLENGEQTINLDWESLEQDSETLAYLLKYLRTKSSTKLSDSEIGNITKILSQSPLFQALGSTSIIVSKEQLSQPGNKVTPFDHISRVANNYIELPIYYEDIIVAQILPWLHDIGKMAGVNFLPTDAVYDLDLRSKLREEYKNDGKHTHPSHSLIGTVITKKLLDYIKQNNSTQQLTEDQSHLLLNVIMHHHDFIFKGSDKNGSLTNWLKTEIANVLLPTLPENRPDLIVRFFTLLFQFRYADIAATTTHHRHWPGNLELFREVPSILQNILPTTVEVSAQLQILTSVIDLLPKEIEQDSVEEPLPTRTGVIL